MDTTTHHLAHAALVGAREASPIEVLRREREALLAAIAHAEEVGGSTAALCAPLHRRYLAVVSAAIGRAERCGDGAEKPQDHYTTHEAARIFQVTPMTIIRWCEEGALRFTRTRGGHRRIARREIEALALEKGAALPWVLAAPTKRAGRAGS